MLAGTRIDDRAEAQRVQNRLNALGEVAAQAGTSFWLDRAKGHVLAVLQDRTNEVSEFVKSY